MPSLRDEIGDFVGIPISFVEDEHQTAESRVVFMILRYHTNRKRKRAFPGYETIMRETGLSRQKTAAGIKVLVATGWLVKHKQFAKVTEYELCYPAPAYSSTGELREGVAIVPQRNAVSSTTEQPPLDNKIEFNQIQAKPRQVGSFDERNDKSPKRGIEEMQSPPDEWIASTKAKMREKFPAQVAIYDEIQEQWWLSRFRDGGIGRHHRHTATLLEYEADFQIFSTAWNKNHTNGNGYHSNGARVDEYRGPVASKKNPKRENCQQCFGTCTILDRSQNPPRARVCNHEVVDVAFV